MQLTHGKTRKYRSRITCTRTHTNAHTLPTCTLSTYISPLLSCSSLPMLHFLQRFTQRCENWLKVSWEEGIRETSQPCKIETNEWGGERREKNEKREKRERGGRKDSRQRRSSEKSTRMYQASRLASRNWRMHFIDRATLPPLDSKRGWALTVEMK